MSVIQENSSKYIDKIINMNCINGLKLLEDECIDLTVTSPPYDDLRKYDGYAWDFETTADQLFRVTKRGVWLYGLLMMRQ